jgi:hypothetical protein
MPSARPLAVYTPLLGRWGQPWIKAHIEQILPGETAAIAICAFEPSGPCWGVDVPLLFVPPPLPAVFTPATGESTMFARLPDAHKVAFASAAHRQRVRDFLIEQGVEVILAQWMDANLPLVDMAQELGLRYCCQAHGTDITAGLRDAAVRGRYRGYNDLAIVVAPSEFGRRQLIELGIRREYTRVIRHTVAVPSSLLPRNPSPVRCLAAGRMDPVKGPLILIDAFRRALAGCPNLHLDYAGDGKLMAAVQDAIRNYGISDHVTLHGFLPHDHLLRLMTRDSILLQPSVADEHRYDTSPVTIAEAMAAGMGIVATRHGGIPEMITDGETGLLVAEHDADALADRIVALATDTELRLGLGTAAWHRARAMFDRDVVRHEWLDVLQLRRPAPAS